MANVKTAPDMFWNSPNTWERAESIFELVDRAWAYGNAEIGDTLTIQRAVRLEDIQVRVIKDPDSPYLVNYEVVQAETVAETNEISS